VQDPGCEGGGVGAQAEAEAFVFRPGVAVADGAEAAFLMDFFDVVPVFFVVAWLWGG